MNITWRGFLKDLDIDTLYDPRLLEDREIFWQAMEGR